MGLPAHRCELKGLGIRVSATTCGPGCARLALDRSVRAAG
jgi:hypothetical protein